MEVRAVSVNGRTYRWPARPTVVVCLDGSAFDYIDRAIAAGAAPYSPLPDQPEILPHRRVGAAQFHQPEQRFDRDRCAAFGAWHQRKLLPRSRDRRHGDDERRVVPRRGNDSLGVLTSRGSRRRGHRQGQATAPARPRRQRSLRVGGSDRRRGLFRTAQRTRAGRGSAPACDGAAGPDVPLDQRLRSAQTSAGRRRGEPVLRRDRSHACRDRSARRHAGDHRRSRHARENRRCRHAVRGLSSGRARWVARRPRRPGGSTDYRPVCAASRSPRRLRDGLPVLTRPRGGGGGSDSGSARHRRRGGSRRRL